MRVEKDLILNHLALTTNLKIPIYSNVNLDYGSDAGMEGQIVLQTVNNTFYGHNGTEWVPFTDTSNQYEIINVTTPNFAISTTGKTAVVAAPSLTLADGVPGTVKTVTLLNKWANDIPVETSIGTFDLSAATNSRQLLYVDDTQKWIILDNDYNSFYPSGLQQTIPYPGLIQLYPSVCMSADGTVLIFGLSIVREIYVYKRTDNVWSLSATLEAPTGGDCGFSVSGNGKTFVAVGNTDTNARVFSETGSVWNYTNVSIGTPYNVVSLSSDGTTFCCTTTTVVTAKIYKYSSGVWNLELTVPNMSGGCSLNSDGTICCIGNLIANGSIGQAVVYFKNNGVWSLVQTLTPIGNIGTSLFGNSAAVSSDGSTICIGGPDDNFIGPIGIGATWVFVKSGSQWIQQAKIVGTNIPPNIQRQGTSVSVSGDGNTLAIGALDDSGGGEPGAVWIFKRKGGQWYQNNIFTSGLNNNYGSSVSLSSNSGLLAVIAFRDTDRGVYIYK